MKVFVVALLFTLALSKDHNCASKSKCPKNVCCKNPKSQLVGLTYNNLKVVPAVDYVRRCDSLVCLNSGHECEPSMTKFKNKTVEVIGPDGKGSCETISIEWHLECKCSCKRICPDSKELDQETCSCRCKDQKKCKGNSMWSHDECRCKCDMRGLLCSVGFKVDEESCKCIKDEKSSIHNKFW